MKKRDIILIVSILAVAAIGVVILMLMSKGGSVAVVSVDGERVAEYPLSKDGEYSINNGTNILKIENGEAYMLYADCPTVGNTKCTHQGKISKTNQKITCIPNRIVITIEGGDVSVEETSGIVPDLIS